MINYIKRSLNRIKLIYNFWQDYRFYVRSTIGKSAMPDKQLANIMLLMHAIEKGMSFTESTREFGKDKIKALVRNIKCYLANNPLNDTIELAIGIVSKYLEHPNATKDESARQLAIQLIACSQLTGVNRGGGG